MRIQNRRIESFIFLTGLLMAVTPMAVSIAVGDNTTTATEKISKHRYDTSYTGPNSASAEIVMLSPTFVRSSDFPAFIQHKPTIRWKFMKEYGVWGVKFHSFSLPYTDDCTTDYLSIRDLLNENHRVIHCGENIPEEFISYGSKLEVEFHSDSVQNFPKFDFRVDHGEDEDDLRKKLAKEHMEPSNIAIEVPLQISAEEKAAIISLSIILPIALVIVGLLTIALAKHMNGEKKKSHQELPTHCPQSKKFIQPNQSYKGDSTVLDFFLDNDKLTVKPGPGKVKLQGRTDKVKSNNYADLPTSLEICTTVANQDITPPPSQPEYNEKLIGFGSLM